MEAAAAAMDTTSTTTTAATNRSTTHAGLNHFSSTSAHRTSNIAATSSALLFDVNRSSGLSGAFAAAESTSTIPTTSANNITNTNEMQFDSLTMPLFSTAISNIDNNLDCTDPLLEYELMDPHLEEFNNFCFGLTDNNDEDNNDRIPNGIGILVKKYDKKKTRFILNKNISIR